MALYLRSKSFKVRIALAMKKISYKYVAIHLLNNPGKVEYGMQVGTFTCGRADHSLKRCDPVEVDFSFWTFFHVFRRACSSVHQCVESWTCVAACEHLHV